MRGLFVRFSNPVFTILPNSKSPAHAGSRNRGANSEIIPRWLFLARSRQPLLFRHLREMSFGSEKLFKGSALHNPTVIQNNDFIHVGQSGETMRNADDRSAFLE
jgi:hypothetical protein